MVVRYQGFPKLITLNARTCKHLLGVKIQTKNSFVYGELGRVPLRNHRLVSVIRYWFKVIQCDDAKYTKLTYNMMLNDLQNFPAKSS